MITEAQFRRYVAQTGADRQIALQEVVLTYALAAVYRQPWSEALAFKGGTALRKLLFGPSGRFSVDLDFLGSELGDDNVVAIAEHLDALDFHGLSLRLDDYRFTASEADHFGRPAPSGFSADLRFACDLGTGRIGFDISRRRPSLLPLRRLPLRDETYHAFVEFDLPVPLALSVEESAAEKVSALARRLEHGNAKDVYDLSLYLPRPQRRLLLPRLVALTFWADSRQIGDSTEFVSKIVPAAFRWEELAGLLPRRPLAPRAICDLVRTGLESVFGAMIADERRLLDDAATHREAMLFDRLAATAGELAHE